MSEFFSMGGYAAFVWPSFIATAIVLIALMVSTIVGLRNSKLQLSRLEAETSMTPDVDNHHET